MRMHALGAFAPRKGHVTLSAYQYAINVFPLFIKYLGKLLLPINLNAFYVFHPIASLSEMKGVLAVIATVVFMTTCCVALKKDRLVFFGLLIVVVPLLPVLYIPALGENAFTERYLYLPSVGFVLLLAIFLSWAMEKLPSAIRGIAIVSMVIGVLYTVGTVNRNNVWKDNVRLWSDTVKKSQDYVDVYNNLALAYASQGQWDKAIAEYQTALRLKPDYADAHNNIGVIYHSQGKLDKALAEYQTALRLNPDYVDAHNNIGVIYQSQGQLDKAIAEYQIVSGLKPDKIEAHFNLGVIYQSQGQWDKAIAEYQTALRLNPDFYQARKLLNEVVSKRH